LDVCQLQFANVKDKDIDASIGFPPIEALLGSDRKPTNEDQATYEKCKRIYAEQNLEFVKKSSPLGKYMEISSVIQDPAGLNQFFDDHFVLPKDHVEARVQEFKEKLQNSPVGKVHGMVGSIKRHDGKTWDYMPSNISRVEAEHLLNGLQTIHVNVKHTLCAYRY
jgi:hypothetical protein